MLLAVAGGGHRPERLLEKVRALRPGLRVSAAYADGRRPSPGEALTLAGGPAVLVPLALGDRRGFADGPLAGTARWIRVAPSLAPDPLLVTALLERLREAERALGRRAGTADAVVLAGIGRRRGPGSEGCCTTAHMLAARLRQEGRPAPVVPAALCGAPVEPGARGTVRALRAQGCRRVAVLPYLLDAGPLAGRLSEARGWVTARPLGAQEALARLVLARYDATLDEPARAAGEVEVEVETRAA